MHTLRTIKPAAASPRASTTAPARACARAAPRRRVAVAAQPNDAVTDAAKKAIVEKIGQDVAEAAAVSMGAPPQPRLPGARPFSTALAIGLASAAFDSYYQALGADETAAWTEASGTRVQYINAGALAAAARGVLTVTLASADGLTAADAWGTSDPYAVVSVGACGHKSATVARSLTPEWAETFDLYVAPEGVPGADKLRVELWDSDLLSKDDALGTGELALTDIIAHCAQGESVTLPLTGEKGDAGTVSLTLSYKPLADADLTARSAGELGAADAALELARMTEAWRKLAVNVGDIAAGELFIPATFVESPAKGGTDTQAWIGYSTELRSVVVAFRGTESLIDVLVDANIIPHGYGPSYPFPPSSRVASPDPRPPVPEGHWVHSGFFNAYASVRSAVWRVVDECMAAAGGGAFHVYVCGHSLGAALATLASYDAAFTTFQSGTVSGLTMYNFGSPRVGNGVFAEAYDAAVPDTWRIVNADDVVARVPRAVGYRHVGHTVGISIDGTFMNDEEAADVLEGVSADSVARSLASAAVAAVSGEDTSTLTATVTREIDFAKALASGDALAQHREALYFETLKKVVRAITGE